MNIVLPAAIGLAALLGVAAVTTTDWDLPPIDNEQTGFRGTAMGTVYDRERVAALKEANQMPEVPWEADPEGPRAFTVYENVQVLRDLSEDQFNRFMQAITEWVAPEEEGCNYCHNPENLADDNVYTKIVARRMIQMNRTINQEWRDHVGDVGVTCYTCHRGQPVPEEIWFKESPPMASNAWRNGQNQVAQNAGNTSLPYDNLSDFLQGEREIRVHTLTALPSGNDKTIMDTEWTYGLMIHMSEALGVNCTYCHNSRAFNAWDESPPARVTAWHGIRMARQLNIEYLDPLQPVYPENRLGPHGDAPKVNCATCHNGVNQPLYGAEMLKDYAYEIGVRE